MRRKLLLLGFTGLITFFCFNSSVFAGAVTSDEEIAISTTGGGIKVKSDNGNSFQVGGRILYDYDNYEGAYNADNNGDTGSESYFRRTRLSTKGTSGKNWAYKLTVDVDDRNNEADIDTAYIKYQGFEHVDLFLGRLTVPIGLEELTSSSWISTIERSIISNDGGTRAGKPDFQIQANAHINDYFGQLALVDEGNQDANGKDVYSWVLRGGHRFAFSDDNHFLHAAASFAYRDFGNEGIIGFETEGGVAGLPGDLKIQNDADFEIDNADQIGIEAAYVRGPFSVQSEYFSNDFNGDTNGAGEISDTDVDADAYYVLLTYFLTGESRGTGYDGEVGKFGKIKPKGTKGAWELVAKYEDGYVDPDNQSSKSRYDLLTLGVNWYANNNVRFMLNYLDLDTKRFDSEDGIPLADLGENDGHAISFRAQFAF